MDTNEHRAARDLLRSNDHDRYIAALLAPSDAIPSLITLYAFNAELARIAPGVSEPMLGEIRLQWWRDAFDTVMAGGQTGHPVADLMGRLVVEKELPFHEVQGMIDARTFDVSGGVMAERHALTQYLSKTDGAVFRLASAILGERGEGVDASAQSASFACGFSRLLAELPVLVQRGSLPLPLSDLEAHGIDGYQFSPSNSPEEWQACLEQFLTDISDARDNASETVRALPRRARSAFLPLALVKPLVGLIRRRGDALDHVVHIGPLTRIWRLWRANRTGAL